MSGDRATAGACIPLRRPDRSFAGFQEREVAAARFFMSRCSLSEADAVEAVKLARGDGAALRLPDQRISFVRVSQYWGGELDWAGPLEPKKLYRLFFSPEALEHAAAASGHGLKLLDCHPREDVDVATDDELRKYCVGEVEDDLRFDGRHLRASIVARRRATEWIKTGERRAWSIGFGDLALDMTPGSHDGEPYDGAVRDLEINHVALVAEGRCGAETEISFPEWSRT